MSGEDPNRGYGWYVKASGARLDRLVGEFLDRARKLGFKLEKDWNESSTHNWRNRVDLVRLSHPEGHTAEVEWNKSRANFRLHWTAPMFREGVVVSKEAMDAFPMSYYVSNWLMGRARAGVHRAAMDSHEYVIKFLQQRLAGPVSWSGEAQFQGEEAERARRAIPLHQIARDYHMERAGLQ
jgi:hypothetical protein